MIVVSSQEQELNIIMTLQDRTVIVKVTLDVER